MLYIIRRANVRKDKKQVGISLIVIKQKMNRSVIKEKSVSLHSLSKTKYRWFLPLVKKEGALAQVVEQWTENPCVLGSTPRGTTTSTLKKDSQRKVNKMPSVITSNSYGTFALSGETSIRYHADMAETPKIL